MPRISKKKHGNRPVHIDEFLEKAMSLEVTLKNKNNLSAIIYMDAKSPAGIFEKVGVGKFILRKKASLVDLLMDDDE